jgi:hypothetical protein
MSLIEFTTSSSFGYVYETEFLFKKTNLPAYNITTWDLGDGTVVYNPTNDEVKHTYKYPGLYKISLSAWAQTGSFESTEQFINVDYKIRDALLISNLPEEWTVVGQKPQQPFTVQLTSAKVDQPLAIVLHSIGSDSVPYTAISDKWNFLVPTWYFINAETETIVDGPIELKTTPLYGTNNTIIAVSATASFYYVDHNSTINQKRTNPIVLTATLSTQHFTYPPESLIYPYQSYSNTETIKAATLWHVYDVVPNELEVTENFLQNIYPVKWSQIPIPAMITCKFNPQRLSAYNFGSHVSATNIFNYPKTNELGKKYPVTVNLSSVKPFLYTSEKHTYVSQTSSLSSNLYFEAFDGRGAVNSGYVFTSLTSLCSVSATKVTASTTFAIEQEQTSDFEYPIGLPTSYVAYVSHPFENNINKIEVNTFTEDYEDAQELKDQGILLEGKITTIGVPPVVSSNTYNLTLSGASGVYALAYNPLKKLLYAADSDSNKIFLYDEHKTLIKTLELSAAKKELFGSVPSLSARLDEIPISPSSLSIDKDHNVWVALHDSFLTLKYDMNLTTRLASAAPISNLTTLFSSIDVKNEPYYTPSVVKTDRNNDTWVSYCHPLSGFLIKYNSDGSQTGIAISYKVPAPILLLETSSINSSLTSVNFKTLEQTPVDIAIAKNNNIWVACREGNKVLHYNGNTGELISDHSFEILHPSYLTVDKQDNLWVLHGYNLITKYDTTTSQASSWKVTNSPGFKYELIRTNKINLEDYSLEEVNDTYQNNEIWGGVAVDLLNRVWAVNSELNSCLVIPAISPKRMKYVSLIAPADTNYFIRSIDDNFVRPISTSFVRSAQAVGDWTGNEWYQKYGLMFTEQSATASSNTFKIYDLYKDAPAVAKVNETFDCAGYFKSLALPELLREYETLFNDFFVSLVGSGSLETEEIGRVLYEKIANFTMNHCDIDTAEVSQFVSLFAKLKQEAETFGINFPVEIERLIDIFSIPLHRLRGIPVYDDFIPHNVGEPLTTSSMITAGTYLYLKDKQYQSFQILQVSTQAETDKIVYPLSSIQITGLKHQDDGEFFKYYTFHEYDPFKTRIGYQSNVIDWQNPYTTTNYDETSWDFYFKQDGFVDLYFNNLLTKRLFNK